MKTRTIQYETFTTSEGNEIELELTISLNSWEDPEVLTKQVGDKIVIGYLAHDDSPENPLEAWDGQGRIHHHPRSQYGSRNSDYYEVLGLDSYGDPKIDEDKVQDLWRDKVLALPCECFAAALPEGLELERFAQDLRLQLAVEEAGDYDLYTMCRAAFQTNTKTGDWELTDEERDAVIDAIEPNLTWDWDEVREACWVGPQQGVVLVDAYEHGGITYSLAGGGMRCRWDTSHGIAAWVPDQCALDEICSRAKVYDHAYLAETNWLKGRGLKYELHCGEFVKQSDDWLELYTIAQDIARLRIKAGIPPQYDGFERARDEIAGNAIELYNQYVNGDVYGVVTATYDLSGELIADESCWGFFGHECAKESLLDEFNATCKNLEKEEVAA